MCVLWVFIYFQTAAVVYLLAPLMFVSPDQVITDIKKPENTECYIAAIHVLVL